MDFAFQNLDKSSLVKILERMDAKGVLALCQTNHHFARVGRDQSVFVRLMEVHYPYFPINQDAKTQYMAIAGGEAVNYLVDIDVISTRIYEAEFDTGDKDDIGVHFSIRGTRIRKGEIVWMLYDEFSATALTQVFMTEEDAIDKVLSNMTSYKHNPTRQEVIRRFEEGMAVRVEKFFGDNSRLQRRVPKTHLSKYFLFKVRLPQ